MTMCGLCLTCWPLPRASGTACHNSTCPCHVERIAAQWTGNPECYQCHREYEPLTGDGDGLCFDCYNAPSLQGAAPHIPTTDYYDGRDGSIEAEDDDEDRIADAAEAWQDYLEFQRTSH